VNEVAAPLEGLGLRLLSVWRVCLLDIHRQLHELACARPPMSAETDINLRGFITHIRLWHSDLKISVPGEGR
jgi:hypothetical protein